LLAESQLAGLSPHGESGLKSSYHFVDFGKGLSLPAWGEWIEIVTFLKAKHIPSVSPRMGRVD